MQGSFLLGLKPLASDGSNFQALFSRTKAKVMHLLGDRAGESLLERIDSASDNLCRLSDCMEFLRSAHKSSQTRADADRCYRMVGHLNSRLNGNRLLYQQLLNEKTSNDQEDDFLLKKLARDFENFGINHSNLSEVQSAHLDCNKEESALWGAPNPTTALRLLRKRQKLANLLGYENYASYRLGQNTLSSQKAVFDFLTLERQAMSAAPGVQEWLSSGLSSDRFLNEAHPGVGKFSLSYEGLRLLLADFYRDIFDVTLTFESLFGSERVVVHCNQKNTEIGVILLETSIPGLPASHFTLISGKRDGCVISFPYKNERASVVALVIPLQDRCAISLVELESIFHEFGHAMHSIFSTTKYQLTSGTRCASDLVEIPSILNEFLLREMLLDAEIAADSTSKKELLSYFTHKRNIDHFQSIDASLMDLKLHSQPEINKSLIREAESLLSLTHIVGYGSCYYSYTFAGAVAFKIWNSMFKGRTVCEKKLSANRLRTKFLSLGGSSCPVAMLNGIAEGFALVPFHAQASSRTGR